MGEIDVCNFVLDLIVTKLEVPSLNIQNPEKLQVEAKLDKTFICLTKSRINVNDFTKGSSTEFRLTPKKMRNIFEKCGIVFCVKYNGFQIGTGSTRFPSTFTEMIDYGMTDLMHVDTCSFGQDKNKVVGTLEFLCRVVIKCDDQPIPPEDNVQCSLNASMNKEDIMFILGAPQQFQIPCDPCVDLLEPEEADELLNLDLTRYHSSTAGAPKHGEIFKNNSICSSVCCEMRKMADDYGQVIDSVLNNTSRGQSLRSPYSTTTDEFSSRCGLPSYYPQKDTPHSSLSAPCFSGRSEKQRVLSASSRPGITNIKPIRFCPICLNNMSWLPKFATCPKCGVKPAPTLARFHDKKELTADQILIDFLGKPAADCHEICEEASSKSSKESTRQDVQARCRCTCRNKLCTHCRIRKLCADIFQTDIKPTSKENKMESNLNNDFRVTSGRSEDPRPHLARVFSELRDLYVKNNTKEKAATAHCEDMEGVTKPRIATYAAKQGTTSANQRRKSTSERICGHRHKACSKRKRRVSRRHGWAWSSSKEALVYGWRPGAILKPIKKLMNYFLYKLPAQNSFDACQQLEEDEKKAKAPLPALHVCKKNGEITIILRGANSQDVNTKPVVFKVVKSDLAVTLSQIKRNLKAKGFRKCTCHKSVMLCVCRNILEKRHLEKALLSECQRRGMESCVDKLVLSDTSDSDMEYDFDVTPPAGVPQRRSPPKPPTANHGTQFSKQELNTKRTHPISPYWRAFDGATGDRYTGTAFGAPGEQVFEDGLFGLRGGGPHGESAAPGGRPKSKGIWGASPGGPMRGGGQGAESFLTRQKVPGATAPPKSGANKFIPVRPLKRFAIAAKKAAQAKEEALLIEQAKQKMGINAMKYLKEHGVFSKKKPKVGSDGLTDAQRRQRALHQGPPLSFEVMASEGPSYNPFAAQYYNQYHNNFNYSPQTQQWYPYSYLY